MSTETQQNWREEQAKHEIGHTTITRPQALLLAGVFLATIVGVPLMQQALTWRQERDAATAGERPAAAEFAGVGPAMAEAWRKAPTLLRRFLAPNAVLLERINAYQQRLDDTCFLTRATQAPVQAVLCRLGAGNEKAYIGRDGWLFFEPGIRYLTGPPFLDPDQLAARARGGNEYVSPPQPDPVEGIAHFRDQLRARGIALVVMPVPVKAAVHPEAFTARCTTAPGVLQNKSFPEFVARLKAAGVSIYDPGPELLALRRAGHPAYLKTDTHWRPEAMQRAAQGVARFVTAQGLVPTEEQPCCYPRQTMSVTNLGDVAVMLRLPARQRLYAPETVTIEPVVDDAGRPWAPDPTASVLLLGDSFANIYTLGDMGWGAHAGLAATLAVALNRPLDAIIRNDAGAYATREILANELARGRDRLAGKQLVIWEFSARELAIGDWKPIALRLDEARATPESVEATTQPNDAAGVRVTAVVADVSDRPSKGAVYKDFIMKLYLTDLKTADGAVYGTGDGVVHVFGMRNRAILPIASVRAGARLTLTLMPWDRVADRYGTMKSGALDDMMLEIDKTLYWGAE